MSSRQMTTIPSAMRSQKISFIIVWKLVGLLVIPKNIIKGSNNLQLVWNMAFHSSPGLIHILLKPQQTLSLVKYFALQSYNTSSEIRGRGYLFLIVMVLRDWQSWTRQSKLFFFLMKKTGAAMGDLEGQIYLVHNFSSRKTSSSFCSTGDREYTLDNLGSDLERSSMV